MLNLFFKALSFIGTYIALIANLSTKTSAISKNNLDSMRNNFLPSSLNLNNIYYKNVLLYSTYNDNSYNDLKKRGSKTVPKKRKRKEGGRSHSCKNPKKKNAKWLQKLKNRTPYTHEECNKATFAYPHGTHPTYTTFLDCFSRTVNCYINNSSVNCKLNMGLCPQEVHLKPIKNPTSKSDYKECAFHNMLQKWPNFNKLKQCLPEGRIGTFEGVSYIKKDGSIEEASWFDRLFAPKSWISR
jgi:hypothetical protein